MITSTTTSIRPTALLSALPYTWKQQLGEVSIGVPVQKATRARDLTIKILKKGLLVGFKGKEPILEGELCKDIKIEESTWTVGSWRINLSRTNTKFV